MATASCTPFYDGGKRRNSVGSHMIRSCMTEKLTFLHCTVAQDLMQPRGGKLFLCLVTRICVWRKKQNKGPLFQKGIRNLCDCWKHWLTKYFLTMASILPKIRVGKLPEVKKNPAYKSGQLIVLKHCLCQQERQGHDNCWRFNTKINLKQLYSVYEPSAWMHDLCWCQCGWHSLDWF